MNFLDALSHALALLWSGNTNLWSIIWISPKTAFIALLITTPIAILSAYTIATHRFFGRRMLIWLIQAALSFPTVLIGLILYLLLSRHGFFGAWHWLFTQTGIIVGQILIALPVLIAFTLAAIQAADPRLAETAISLGASRWQVMRTILLELRYGVIVAIVSGFGRVISEVGCAMMIGGNIAGETRTITTAIALETSKGNFSQGIALGFVLMCIALLVNAVLMLLQGEANVHRSIE